MVKNHACNVGGLGSNPRLGRFLERGRLLKWDKVRAEKPIKTPQDAVSGPSDLRVLRV